MSINRFIVVRTNFVAFHKYRIAGEIDPSIKFLENIHRHNFHVTVKIQVHHDDRELEFFLVKKGIEDWIGENLSNKTFESSCEMFAEKILKEYLFFTYGGNRMYTITVSEDGESDGIIEYNLE
jgi:hypothetical protein